MRTFTVEQAKEHFDDVVKQVRTEPVTIMRNGKVACYFMPPNDYQEMRQFYAHRASETFRRTAQRIGMTEEEARKLIENDD